MGRNSEQPLIISASRTKDMVRRSPDLLAEILQGKAPCRWGPHGPFGQVDPERVHTVVLWTKDPRNLLHHRGLRDALRKLHTSHSVQISLQLTATGLGGSFIEPGIPTWREVHSNLSKLLSEGWINPASVVFRCDPFLSVRTPGGKMISNAGIQLFELLISEFVKLGIPRVTVSRADAVNYPRVAERLHSLGLEWVFMGDENAVDLCCEMEALCHSKGADFSVCCDPPAHPLLNKWGCIDARWLNRVKGDGFPPATETLHNEIGRQRPTCRCTYSRDIGYSTGSATCYSGGFGCLYCYSQGRAKPPDIGMILKEIQDFDRNLESHLSSRNLPVELIQTP